MVRGEPTALAAVPWPRDVVPSPPPCVKGMSRMNKCGQAAIGKVTQMKLLSTLGAALLALAASAVQAQDPPGRVGRLAYTEGSVSVYMDPELGWEPGYVNTPITSENSVWTDTEARAELRIGPMAIRLDETTQLDIAELDDGGLHAHIVRGAVNVRVRHFLPNDRIQIDTP